MVQRSSPFSQRVDPHDITFEASSGFTHVAARRLADPPMVGHCPESFGKSVALLASSVATGVHRQFPRPDLHRQEHGAFSRRAWKSRLVEALLRAKGGLPAHVDAREVTVERMRRAFTVSASWISRISI